ncbi:helix-turn-helix domain-containing protein, partial [Fructilactobacillus sanfranciscensis]
LKAINFYKNNDVSLKETCKKFNIKSHSNLTYWINSYNFNGVEGLKLKANKKYSVEFKASVVNYYKTHEINPRDLAII